MRKTITIFVLFIMLVTSFTGIFSIKNVKASGNTLYVGGSGPGNYTSIQSAIDAASNGDTIYVYHGIYNENVVVDKNNLTLQGEKKETTFINSVESNVTATACFYVDTFHSSKISGFTLHCDNSPCAYFRDSYDNLIFDCILKNSSYGVFIYTERNSINNTVRDCEIYNNSVGIGVNGAAENYYLNRSNILNCYIHNNRIGVYVYGRSDWYGVIKHTTISGCNVFNNSDEGIFINQLLGEIQGVTIENNNIRNNSNSGIEIRNASNIDISDCVVHNNSNGISANNIVNCIIKNITSYSNSPGVGIILGTSENGTIFNSICYNNNDDGIRINSCNDCYVLNCDVYNNGDDGIDLSWAPCINNIISGNNCTNNRHGIVLFQADNNYVYNNELNSNRQYGIYPWSSSNNNIYHNNLLNNNQNANDANSNTWYNTSFHEGNYWSDYTGLDADFNGIGDSPYNIPGGSNQDLYPLMTQYGSENVLPVADAGGPYYANVGNSIIFSGSGSSDTDGTISGYRWDFTNDGTYDTDWLTSATTTHSYPAVGTYTVKLEVKDNAGGTDTDTATAYITTEGGAIPTADVNGPYSGYVNYPVLFSSVGSIGGSEGTITAWYWTFGDGAVNSQQNPTHTYTSSGIFTVTLKVTNNYGQTNTDTTSVTITKLSPNQKPPVANAGGSYSGVVGSPITFNGSGSNDLDGTIVSYGWNFGDGTTGTGITTTHTYSFSGNYTVILTVTDNDSLTNSNVTTASINASGPPTIVIVVDVSNIEPIEEENEKTIPVTVFCYHQSVSNIHLEILESSNLTITLLSPNITLNPGEQQELLIKIKAPKLKANETVGSETIKLKAVGDGNVSSNTEQINIKVIKKGATPGFELIFVLSAIIVAIFLWRKRRIV